jgi:hypothetical protein
VVKNIACCFGYDDDKACGVRGVRFNRCHASCPRTVVIV